MNQAHDGPPKPPDLQALVGEFGGYNKLTVGGWAHWDSENVFEWSPEVPPPRSLTHREIARYRIGRNALIAEVAARGGLKILIVE
jgi:hypothetical protein